MLTVMRVEGKENPEFFIALLTRSLLSWIATSGSPTILNAGSPLTDTERTLEQHRK